MVRERTINRELYKFPVWLVPLKLDCNDAVYHKGQLGFAVVRTDLLQILATVSPDYVLEDYQTTISHFETVLAQPDKELKDIILYGKDKSNVCVRYVPCPDKVGDYFPFIELKLAYGKQPEISYGLYDRVFRVVFIWKTWTGFEGITTIKTIESYIEKNFKPEVMNSLFETRFDINKNKLPLSINKANAFAKRIGIKDISNLELVLPPLCNYIEEICMSNPEEAFEIQKKMYSFITKLKK